MTKSLGRADVAALASYLVLACLFFWPVLFTNAILIGYDTVTIFYPHRAVVARALLAGRVPLWNPDHFLGAPLLANPQVAVFYLLNWPFLTLSLGLSLASTIAFHFVLAGIFMYAFCRLTMGLSQYGAWIAGIAFAFGGFMAQQTGHVNQVSVAAWLPLILLLGRQAWQNPSWPRVVRLGLVIALQLLAGHSQESYMILVLLATYLLFLAIERYGIRRVIASWRGLGAVILAVCLGTVLAAVQLLPTFELSRLSIRSGGLSFRQASSFSLRPQDVALALLPNYQTAPPSEMAAYVGVAGLLLAVIGVRFFPRRTTACFFTLVAAGALLLALGRYTPVYWLAYYGIPGVSFFRVPARWLLLYSFAVATLAGMGLDVILSLRRLDYKQHGHFLLAIGVAFLLFVGMVALFASIPPPETVAAWLLLLIIVTGIIAVPRTIITLPLSLTKGASAVFLGVILVAELYAAGCHLEYSRYTAPESIFALRPTIAYLKTRVGVRESNTDHQGVFRVLSISNATWDPGDLADIRSMLGNLDNRRVAEYIDTVKNKELLTANLPSLYGLQTADGYDGGVLPLRRYVEMEGLFLASEDVSPDGRLRDHLNSIPEARLLGLLNVAYVIADKTHDTWIDDMYYDLAFAMSVTKTLTLSVSRPFIATSVGLISRLEGVEQPTAGTAIGRMTLVDTSDRSVAVDIRAGDHTGMEDSPLPMRTVSQPSKGRYIHAILPLSAAVVPHTIIIDYNLDHGHLSVLGLSLIDDRTRVSLPVVVCPDFELVHDGDVKVYYNRRVLPRAYIVHMMRDVTQEGNIIAAMRDPSFDPTQEALVEQPWQVQLAPSEGTEWAEIIEYTAERVLIKTRLSSPGILVLSDAFYPGWNVHVDGIPTTVKRVNYLFRGVYLEPGDHLVEFNYRPRSVIGGGIISLIAVAITVIGLIKR